MHLCKFQSNCSHSPSLSSSSHVPTFNSLASEHFVYTFSWRCSAPLCWGACGSSSRALMHGCLCAAIISFLPVSRKTYHPRQTQRRENSLARCSRCVIPFKRCLKCLSRTFFNQVSWLKTSFIISQIADVTQVKLFYAFERCAALPTFFALY